MPGKRDARQRILDAAAELVTTAGVAAATPAAIAERAGAGKMSLYRHFSGKDELVAEALSSRDLGFREWLLGGPEDGTPRERLLALFDGVANNADREADAFAGCPYVRTRLDLAGVDHPAAKVVAAHKEGMINGLAALLTEIGVPNPDQQAHVILMLLDGAMIHAVIRGSGDPVRDARTALLEMISTS